MKKLFNLKVVSTLLFICIQITAWSQFSFGYRSHFGGMKPYKEVTQFYNDNRPWLDKELSTSAYMHGYEVGLGGGAGKFSFTAVRFYAQFGKTRAKGTSMGKDYERIVRTRSFGIETIDVIYSPLEIKGVFIGFGVMPLGLGIFKIDTYLKE